MDQPADFYARLPTYGRDDPDGAATALEADGFALLPGVLTPAEVAAARDRIDALTPEHWDFVGATAHYKNVFNRDPLWLPLLDRPGVIELAERCLGADCHVIGQTAWRSTPGHRGVGLHLDYLPMTWPDPGVPDGLAVPMFLCTAHLYLSPQHPDLCPTHVIPGSHRAGRSPRRDEFQWRGRQPQPVLCEAGDVLFFRSDLWHSGSKNRTADESRYLLQVHYGRREMAQHFSPYMTWRFNPAVLSQCSHRQMRLLGDHPRGAYD